MIAPSVTRQGRRREEREMPRKAGIGALLLIGIGIGIGATVFRSDIAQATGLAQAVTVNNTAAQAVPVREQNLDGGNIKVHEEGTASVHDGTAAGSVPVKRIVFLHEAPGFLAATITPDVPAGKTLVVTDIFAAATNTNSAIPLTSGDCALTITGSGQFIDWIHLLPGRFGDFSAALQTHIPLSTGEDLGMQCFIDTTGGFVSAQSLVSGYLVPA